jgi:hypothetical protein
MARAFHRRIPSQQRQQPGRPTRRQPFGGIADVFDGLRQMLRIALAMNRRLVIAYYLTAAIGASTPIVAGLASRYLVDNLVAARGSATAAVPLALTAILAGYYLMGITGDVVQWSLNQTYLDHLMRYRLQDRLNVLFSQKLTELDFAHLEDPG